MPRRDLLDGEPWSENIDDLLNVIPESPEIAEHERMFRIAQRYIDGLATLHLHLRVRPRSGEPDPYEFCAVVSGGLMAIGEAQDISYVTDPPGPPREVIRGSVFAGDDDGTLEFDPGWSGVGVDDGEGATDMGEPMLVRVVQPTDDGERVRVRRLGSNVVGLKPLDECAIIRAYAAKHPGRVLSIPLPAFIDGELSTPSGTPTPSEDKLPKEIVQRGPQVVAELSDDDSDVGIGGIAGEAKDVLACIALEVTDDAAIFIVKEGAPFFVERGQVFVRALKSKVDAG